MELSFWVIFTLIDTWWIQRFYPDFHYPKVFVFLAIIFYLGCFQKLNLLPLMMLAWMGWIDQKIYHVSDLSCAVLIVTNLFQFTHHDGLSFVISVALVLPFVLLSSLRERFGWGDTLMIFGMSFVLSAFHMRLWIMLFLLSALIFAWMTQKKTQSMIALGPHMAITYFLVLLLLKA